MKLFETKIDQHDIDNKIAPVLLNGELGFGKNVSLFEEIFSNYSNSPHNTATNSASAAAFMIFAYLKEKYGSCDVYTPSVGFASPAWAAKHFGHNLIWVEVDNNILFDVNDYKEKRKYRCERYSDGGVRPVVMPILYGGVSNIPDLDKLHDDGYNETIIIDSAHCITPNVNADFVFYSFHPFKPVAASDGGLISTFDSEADDYFKSYRNFGRVNNSTTYDITQNGFKFYMNNLNATIALTQLDRYQENLQKRKDAFKRVLDLKLPGRIVPHDISSSYYFATLICDGEENTKLLYEKYPTSKHYPLLHKTEYFNDSSDLPFTEDIHKYILNLPLYDKDIYNS